MSLFFYKMRNYKIQNSFTKNSLKSLYLVVICNITTTHLQHGDTKVKLMLKILEKNLCRIRHRGRIRNHLKSQTRIRKNLYGYTTLPPKCEEFEQMLNRTGRFEIKRPIKNRLS